MIIYYTTIFFIFGLIFGSFYNVVGLRLPINKSIVKPPSECPNCNYKLRPLDLIPVFSYLFLGGKCRNCKTKIKPTYAIFELFTGILFALSYLKFGLTLELIIALTVVSLSTITLVSDLKYMIILDSTLIISAIIIYITKIFQTGLADASMSLLFALEAFIFMYLIKIGGDKIFKQESMGGGDIKLMFVLGLLFGLEKSVLTLFLSALIGLPVAIFFMIVKKEKNKEIPFGPFLVIAALIIYFTGLDISFLLNI